MKFNKDSRLMTLSTYGDRSLTADAINKLIELEKASIEHAKSHESQLIAASKTALDTAVLVSN